MKKKLFQKAICLFLSVTLLFGVVGVSVFAASSSGVKYGSNRDTAESLEEMKELVGVMSYEEYLEVNGDAKVNSSQKSLSIDIFNYAGNAEVVRNNKQCLDSFAENQSQWQGFDANDWAESVYLPASGSVTWTFSVPDGAEGYYYIKIEYYSCMTAESTISSIERRLLIDGSAPFDEASYITLNKNWSYANSTTYAPVATDKPDGVVVSYPMRADGYYKVVSVVEKGMETVTEYKITQDINGNSMSPEIVQTPAWNTYYCQDSTGYYDGYFRFYFTDDDHKISLVAEREPIIIKSIELVPFQPMENDLPSYKDVQQEYDKKGYKPATGNLTLIQAEFPDYVSDSSVAAANDNTSVGTYPSVAKAQVFNVIGKNSFNGLGQWAAYKFRVDDTGLYKLSMRYLQSALQGMYVCRSIKLAGGIYGLADGTPEVPFAEAYDAQFDYSKEWVSDYVSDSEGNVFEFYFEEGVEYTLYIECSLGSLKSLIQRVETSMVTLNECYLRILQLTGSTPDEYRDYGFYEILPDVLIEFLLQAIELSSVKDELEELCGTNGAHIATLETVAILLDKMGSDDGDNVAANLGTLKSYLGTLGTWINNSKQGNLILDSIAVVPSGASKQTLKEIPEADAGFFKSLWYEITSFVYSFLTDYTAMGLTTEPDPNVPAVDVWLATGRDQSNIWRSMIDAHGGYTGSTGNAVTLKLVTGGTLLPSILSGKGPDVYIGLASADVINYAIRDAVIGISGNSSQLLDSENAVFSGQYFTFHDEKAQKYYTISRGDYNSDEEFAAAYAEYSSKYKLTFTSDDFQTNVGNNYVPAAMDTVTLLNVSYGLPQTMTFAMMFYRMDVLAELGQEVPETWDDILSILPALQTNNMAMGIDYVSALDFMMYQRGGNMWKYTDIPEYAGAKINLDSQIALDAFDFVCSLYSDYSFPVSYDASNRFRTGEMPIIVGGYSTVYNTLVVYATEIDGLWSFCPLPGSKLDDGTINYNSLAAISATVILHGCDQMLSAWQFMQWQSSADVQSNYGNRMVALIGPSAKYEAANVNAIKNLSWTATERAAIEDQMAHLSSIVNYPGSYIIARYMKFAFLDAVNSGADPMDAMTGYIDAINEEITRKREEFKNSGLKTLAADETPETAKD